MMIQYHSRLMRLLLTAWILMLSGCSTLGFISDLFGDSSNTGTQVETNVDAQFGGERQNKASGTDNKTEIEEINAQNANTSVDNSSSKQTFDGAKTNNVQNQIGLNHWFWMAIIGWVMAIIGWFMPTPSQIFRLISNK